MIVRAHKTALGEFPPPSARWRWSDVIGTGDSRVDPKVAHAVRGCLVRHDDGTYSTSKRIAEYLREKHQIKMTGSPVPAEQATLPGTPAPEASPGAVRLSPGDNNADTSPSPRDSATAPGWQVSLDGARVHADQLTAATMAEDDRTTDERIDAAHSQSERAAQDEYQASLSAFVEVRMAGRFGRPVGSVYSGVDVTLNSARQAVTPVD